MTQKEHKLTAPEALALVERYFEARTSAAEERLLRAFLLSPEGADARFDEVRATLFFLQTGRRHHRPVSHRHIVWAAAACLAAVCFVGALSYRYFDTQNLCTATVAGKQLTAEQATDLMQHQMEEMFNPEKPTAP